MVKKMTAKQARYVSAMFDLPPDPPKKRGVSKKKANAPSKQIVSYSTMGGGGKGILSLYPPIKFIKMSYNLVSGLSTGTTQSTVGSVNSFNLNSISSPNTTGTGYRPLGYDQISSIYKKYKVYGAKVKVMFNNPTSDGIYCAARVLSETDSDSLASEDLSIVPTKKWTFVKPINNTGKQMVSYKRYWNIAKIQGLDKAQMKAENKDLVASIGGSPAITPTLEVGVANSANTSDITVNYRVEITYYVQLYDRVNLAVSVIP